MPIDRNSAARWSRRARYNTSPISGNADSIFLGPNIVGKFQPIRGRQAVIFTNKEITMNLTLSIGPLVSLIAGILILIMPRLLNYIVAFYLIVIGLLGLFGAGNLHLR